MKNFIAMIVLLCAWGVCLAQDHGAAAKHEATADHAVKSDHASASEHGAKGEHSNAEAYKYIRVPKVEDESWPGTMMTIVLIMFGAAALFGPIVRFATPQEAPVAHHDDHGHDDHDHGHDAHGKDAHGHH